MKITMGLIATAAFTLQNHQYPHCEPQLGRAGTLLLSSVSDHG